MPKLQSTGSEQMSKKINQKNITENKQYEESCLQCLICLEDDQDVFEEHHIFGRNNSNLVTTLCKNCHSTITAEQNKMPRESRSKNSSYLEKIAYQLISIGALLREIGKQLLKIGHELIDYAQNCS